jgi:hypothetical protein
MDASYRAYRDAARNQAGSRDLACGASVTGSRRHPLDLSELRRVMAARNDLWFGILERGLEGIVAPRSADKVPYAWQLDALMNGLVALQAITTEADVSFADIENVVVATALEHGRAIAKGNGSVTAQAGGSVVTWRGHRRRAGLRR